MPYVFWQAKTGDKRQATVRGAVELGLPTDLDIVAAVSDGRDLRGPASYIQLAIPGVGPELAWVGVPGGGQRDGHFVHPRSGKTLALGELRLAIRYAMDATSTGYPRDGAT